MLLVAYSNGIGGGIERYTSSLEDALRQLDRTFTRLNLYGTGTRPPGAHGRYRLASARRQLAAQWTLLHDLRSRLDEEPINRIVLNWINLLPIALHAARHHPATGITVVLHGNEIWAPGLTRRMILRQLAHPQVRTVAVSGFSAGALYPLVPSGVLHPGIAAPWFDALVAAGAQRRPRLGPIRLMTSFRLPAWRDKGLPEIIDAMTRAHRADLTLRVCGSGPVPADLRRLIAGTPRCEIHQNLSDAELAAQFAMADIFILATRLRRDGTRSGEGFGMVLAEAQLAGTPVIAPAFGGGTDAFQPGLTGLCPSDESPAALARVLDMLVSDPARLAEMGQTAARWARFRFDPLRYARHAGQMLL